MKRDLIHADNEYHGRNGAIRKVTGTVHLRFSDDSDGVAWVLTARTRRLDPTTRTTIEYGDRIGTTGTCTRTAMARWAIERI